MNDETNKETIEKIISSKYFETLTDEQLKKRMSEIYQSNKWLFRTAIVVIGIIAFILGYKFYDLNTQFENYQSRLNAIGQKEKDIEEKRLKFEIQLTDIKSKADLEENNRSKRLTIDSEREKITNEYKEMLQKKLEELKIHSDQMSKNATQLEELTVKTNEAIAQSKTLNEKLNNVYTKRIEPDLKILDDRTNLIELTSSTRYLFAERSDRNVNGIEYRPATLKLPFSKDYLRVVFYDVISDENPKEILVDFYLNKNEKAFDQSVFTEREGNYDLNKIEFKSSEGNEYQVSPVFIYLPPNPPLYRFPDFAVLRISMTKKNR